MRTLLAAPLVALVTGCAASAQHVYRPTPQTVVEDAPGDVDERTAATYPVGRGEVKIAALGADKEKLPEGKRFRRTQGLLQVRMIVRNGGAEPWTVDTTTQTGIIGGARRQNPVRADVDGQPLQTAVIMPGETRTIDLYYEVPAALARPEAMPSLGVEWSVQTPEGVVRRATSSFQRHDIAPPPPPPADPKRMVRDLARDHHDEDGMPAPPGRADASGWSSWRN